MTKKELSALSVMVELALSAAKKGQREQRAVIQDLAKMRDLLETLQPTGGTNNDNSSKE